MKFTTSLLLPALAAAAPIADSTLEARGPSGAFTLMSVRSASPIHFGQINAAGRNFWINKNTATYCPSGVNGLDCSKVNSNVTSLSTAETGVATGAGMNVIVPGGQLVYVEKNGALGFTQAHSASIPTGAYTTGFVYTAPTSKDQPWGYLTFTNGGATGFVACPATEQNVYQIFANVKGKNVSKCIGFSAFAVPYNGTAAWQYT